MAHNIKRPIAFVLAATNHGSMIVNRNDFRMVDAERGYGVGHQLLNTACFDADEVNFVLALLRARREAHGDGIVAIDCGANIGVHTVEWARQMHGWGRVVAFEAQETIYYALAGNVALNNCLNATAKHAAVGKACGQISVPRPDYLKPSSFGSLELRMTQSTEFIGQQVSYHPDDCVSVALVSVDSLRLPRVDLIKIDVEGMEMDVLLGASTTIGHSRPVLVVEIIKSDKADISRFLAGHGYAQFPFGLNVLAIHDSDPTLQRISATGNAISIRA